MQIFNSRNEFYKKPFGAVKENTAIDFTIAAERKDITPHLLITKKGMENLSLPMTFTHEKDGKFIFAVSFMPKEYGIYFYNFTLDENIGIYNGEKGEGVVDTCGNLFQLTVYKSSFSTPEKAKGKIFYQIFPDRFYESKEKRKLSFEDRVYRKNKNGMPYFYPTEQPDGYLNKDYYGGDLAGITEKLPYLKELNVSYIYLNPIFEAHSNHRYNTANYMKIDPDLGTLEDFKTLCQKAKELGIYIILDGVFSHTGSDSIYFNKEKRYGNTGAYNDPRSPYRSWFDFNKKYAAGYRAWWDFDTLPEVEEMNPDYIEFICGKGGVIDYWLSMGADGFRLDVADELPDDFIRHLRKAVKSHGEDKLLIGEVWEDATNKISFGTLREYLLGDGLDSTMNYPFRVSILDFLRNGNGYKFSDEIITICENYPKEALDVAMNNLSTHDTTRAMTALAGDNPDGTDRFWQDGRYLSIEQYERAQKLIVCGFALLFALPGVPCIYYGDEIGMQGYRDPFNRGYFKWWAVDEYIQGNVKTLGKFRAEHSVFTKGRIHFAYASENSVAIVRYFEQNGKEVLIGVNRGDTHEIIEYRGVKYTIPSMNYIAVAL